MHHPSVIILLLFLLLLLLFFSLLLAALASSASSSSSSSSSLLNFNVASFSDSSNEVELVQEGDWYTGKQDPTIDISGSVWLTPDPRLANSTQLSIVGRVVYKRTFLLSPSVSFSTFFRFNIVTNGTVGTCGSGMAFFISTSKQAPNDSIAGALGLVAYQNSSSDYYHLFRPPYPFFAVEFDTRISPAYRDVSGSHIGIDVNSLVSANVIDTNDTSNPLYLYANYQFSAWVDYSATSQMIEVRVTNATDRPSSPCVSHRADLSSIFPPGSPLYVGFSATNRPSVVCPEGVAIHSWNFSSSSLSSDAHTGANSPKLALLIVPPLVVTIAIAAFCWILFLKWKRLCRGWDKAVKLTFATPPELEVGAMEPLRKYSYLTLRKATDGFDERNKLGEGAHGVVYKGVLPECKKVVAIKRIFMKGGAAALAEAEMRREMRIIDSIRHRNLLRLHGWCYEGRKSKREPMLVYEYMSNGSLDSYIYGSRKGWLSGEARLKILRGVAAGIEYLHSSLGECILHRDIKAANVLLTEDYEAVVGDFGLARVTDGSVTTGSIAGTVGYMAPDVVTMGKTTRKGDVYSFGVLAMEVVCGRRCLDPSLPIEQMYVVEWAWQLHSEGNLEKAIDPYIRQEWEDERKDDDDEAEERRSSSRSGGDAARWIGVLWLALMCCHPRADQRPDMRQVSQTLCNENSIQADHLQRLPSCIPPFPNLYMYTAEADH